MDLLQMSMGEQYKRSQFVPQKHHDFNDKHQSEIKGGTPFMQFTCKQKQSSL